MTMHLAVLGLAAAAPSPVPFDYIDLGEAPTSMSLNAAPGVALFTFQGRPNELALFEAGTLRFVPFYGHFPWAVDLGRARGVRVTENETIDGPRVDLFTREIVAEDVNSGALFDVDGNGLPDIHQIGQGIHFQYEDGWEIVPFPTPDRVDPSTSSRFIAVGDLDGDGYADLLFVEDLLFEFTGSWYCWLDYDSGQISLFRGSPSGYEATAAWTLRTDAPIGDAVAVQNDDDPELELLLQDGDPSTLSYCPPPERGLYLVDGVTDAPNVSLLWSFVAATAFEALEPFDDLDGDGRADVVFYAMVYSAASGTDEHTLARSLLSTRGWSPSDPGFTIPLYTDKVGFLGGTDIEGRAVADIDLDGRLDIVTALMVDYPHNIAYAYVWYPSREPAPLDTGAPDTGGTAETGATVETGGPVDSGGPTASPPPEDACGGCATGAPWSAWVLVPWVAAMRRRASGVRG